MQTLKFKTNIKCSGCIAASTPHLDSAVGAGNWQVDTQDPAKVLTVTADDPKVNAPAVIEAVQRAGYNAEPLA
ncbi:heavy metal transport/detoxification protein [Flaviaesturariibacter amylovorans]|uniref:HMA domain-containing protein n=1 Tax=Flaviaesturariibacter amylovorans TaxID=1084520 RepID=A0ABP8GCB8_9BACT